VRERVKIRKRVAARKRGRARGKSPIPASPIVSVIVPARNESRTIGKVVRNAKNIMRRSEVIVVVNGSADRTASRARRAGARVVRFNQSLGHDVGRSIGARLARGHILLFVDADFVLPAAVMRSFVLAVLRGSDVVLNRYSGFASATSMHSTAEAKRVLNKISGRPDLAGSSLTAVPHAMTKAAAQQIGYEHLAVPPKAQAIAIAMGLTVTRGRLVEVSKLNRRRGRRKEHDPIERLILGDHAEALAYLVEARGHRAGLTDLWRQREYIEGVSQEELLPPVEGLEPRVSVVIAARNEEATIREVIWSAKALVPEEIIVVVNGSADTTAAIAKEEGVRVYEVPEPLGHDVGRAVGAAMARCEILLFLDSDMTYDPKELWPYIAACRNGADVALNNVNPFLNSVNLIDGVSMAKQYLNRMTCVPNLGFASLTAVPHAMRRETLDRIGIANLAVPPLAQAIAVVQGMNVVLTEGVDVFHSNRRRKVHREDNVVEQLILGDHVEAFQWLHAHFGPRVFFPDSIRRRGM
jgi:glycosyltransferase involved in cell wall biosynthesis